MRTLHIDVETYSDIDLKNCGVYRYVSSQNFEILLFAYSVDAGEVKVVDLAGGETLPPAIMKALSDSKVTKYAYNAVFEWACISKWLGCSLDIRQWKCSMVRGLYAGLPNSLRAVSSALGLKVSKLDTGTALIRYFCMPCKPTRANGGRTRNFYYHDLDKWLLFKEYNARDVEVELAIDEYLDSVDIELPQAEWELWHIDTCMNSLGVAVDRELVESALAIDDDLRDSLMCEAIELTWLKNPNSNSQLLEWVNLKGVVTDNLRKDTVKELLARDDIPEDVRRVLEIKSRLSKTSISKYKAMSCAMGEDDRARGLLQFYGANATGRWAGRLVQVQNLPRNYITPLDTARNCAKARDVTVLRLLYSNVPDTLSQLIRTAFIPSEGRKFIVSDYSAIEARVLAWLAGEQWVMDVFSGHGKIYEATASQMFGVPIEKISKGNAEYELRQKGKVATLALGYQGGVNALKAMGALSMGLSENELPEIVERWRGANPHIVKFWYDVGSAALDVMSDGVTRTVGVVSFDYIKSFFVITLPSKRRLYYPEAHININQFGKDSLFYKKQELKGWSSVSTYGGKLVENITQAIARDCLAVALVRLNVAGYKTVMHVHDEVVIDADKSVSVEDINEVLDTPIEWAKGLKLKAAGFESEYYMKD